MIALVSGVAGSGKSTIGSALARRLGWTFIDGDTLHPPANIERMRSGNPLTDDHREPWLAALQAEVLRHISRDGPHAVIAASALRRRHRRALLTHDPRVLLVFLDTSPELAETRAGSREGHFFRPELVQSQFADLEPPEHALVVDASASVEEIVERVALEVRGMVRS